MVVAVARSDAETVDGLAGFQLGAWLGETDLAPAVVVSATRLMPLTFTGRGLTLPSAATTITLSRKVDPALIGGVVTRIGDKVYDGSIRTRLEELRTTALQA